MRRVLAPAAWVALLFFGCMLLSMIPCGLGLIITVPMGFVLASIAARERLGLDFAPDPVLRAKDGPLPKTRGTARLVTPVITIALCLAGFISWWHYSADSVLLQLWHSDRFLGTKTASVEQLKNILGRGADVNAMNGNGETALMLASWAGDVKCVRFLLSKGAAVYAVTRYGTTALWSASDMGSPGCVEALLDKGAKANERNKREAQCS